MPSVLIVIVLLLMLGFIPAWPHSRDWGYAPSGILGLLLIVLILMAISGRL